MNFECDITFSVVFLRFSRVSPDFTRTWSLKLVLVIIKHVSYDYTETSNLSSFSYLYEGFASVSPRM